MENRELAGLLYELGTLIARSDADGRRFRAQAYQRAADAISTLDVPVAALGDAELTAVPGVGPGVAARIREALATGTIRRLDELRARDPAGAEALLRVPGLGPRSVARLRDELGVTDIDGLRRAVEDGRLRTVRGIGVATEDRVRAALLSLHFAEEDAPTPIAEAVPLAARVTAALRRIDGVVDVRWAGPLRRMRPLVDRIDLVVVATAPRTVGGAVKRLPLLRPGATTRGSVPTVVEGTTHDGPRLAVHVTDASAAGLVLLLSTGDEAYVAALRRRAASRGLSLDAEESGARRQGTPGTWTDEQTIHAALGLAVVPPERREGASVVDLAAADRLPVTAEVDDLRGDLHDHTDRSGDGRMSLDVLVTTARSRGWSYLAVTDHAENLRLNGLDRAAMLAQREEIRERRRDLDDLALLHGVELNIDAVGGVDYDASFLTGYDWTVASVHSHFGLDPAAQTRRLVTTIRNPAVRAIGHLSGRRIGRRPGIRFDVEAVLDACRETGTALEINCHLDRLDATDDVLRAAAERGVLTVISTDAHRLADLDHHRWGVAWARRGGVPRHLVTNTWPVEQFLAWTRGDG